MARRPLVMGNWKLNGSKAFTKELIEGLKAELHDVTGCDVAIAPPVMYLGTAEAALSGCGCSCGGKSVIQLGAQNVDINVKGAFTGDISSEMLKDFGAKYITGGAIATSQPVTSCNSAFNPSINSLVNALEPFNFQLPITKGRRAIFVSPY